MRVAIQSGCVTKILALQRWSKNDFPPEFPNRQMHSFPIMYNTMGSKLDGLAVRDHFLPKNGLKTAILGLTILDRLTSEGAGTKIFEDIANFSMCFEKCGTLSSIWAMGKASSFKIVRTTGRYFFGRGGHENLQKTDFFRKTLAPEKFIIGNFFQHRTIWKLTSGRFRKCISYEAYGDFYASYHRSKSTHGWKSESVPIIMRCPKKKDTATILIITAWNWISVETTMLVPRWFNFGAQNSKLWPCLFFLTSPLLKIFSPIFTQLWRPISMVWNLQN